MVSVQLNFTEKKIMFNLKEKIHQNNGYFNACTDIRINNVAYQIINNRTCIIDNGKWIMKSPKSDDYRIWTAFDILDKISGIKTKSIIEKELKNKNDNIILEF
jgi:hypothetical protein